MIMRLCGRNFGLLLALPLTLPSPLPLVLAQRVAACAQLSRVVPPGAPRSARDGAGRRGLLVRVPSLRRRLWLWRRQLLWFRRRRLLWFWRWLWPLVLMLMRPSRLLSLLLLPPLLCLRTLLLLWALHATPRDVQQIGPVEGMQEARRELCACVPRHLSFERGTRLVVE